MIHQRRQYAGAIIILLLLAVGWGLYVPYFSAESPCTWAALALTAGIICLSVLNFELKGIWGGIVALMVPTAAFYILEAYTHVAFTMKWQIQLLNIVMYIIIYMFMIMLVGRISASAVIFLGLMMCIGLVNYYTIQFRSSPILPWDLLSVRTALSVTRDYTFKVTDRVLMVSLMFLLAIVLVSKIDLTIKGLKKRMLLAAASLAAIVSMVLTIQIKSVGDFFELDDILFTPNVLYRNNGFVVAFSVNMQYLKIREPEGYDVSKLEQLAKDYGQPMETSDGSGTDQKPNIIVIMNEAFSDLAAVTDFDTNEDYMPFIRSLMDGAPDTISGQLFVSVCGGNTANSEYEFLTGNSMSFLPEGSVAYQQYIHDETPSLAWQLKSQGYGTFGMHPYYEAGWDRDEVYPFLGFDTVKFKEQMGGAKLLRQYISDEASYDIIRDAYADKDDAPLFTFEVTMQNHGGYFKDFDNFDREIELVNVPESNNRTITERYLSLIKKSDTAFEALVSYFESYDEPTIIVMFGDHQPGDYVLKSIYTFDDSPEIETLQSRYVVPFVMWANYDIEEMQTGNISLNYLSTLLMETAGLSLSPYQCFLKDLQKAFPVINSNGVIDASGRYFTWNEEIPDEEGLLSLYKCIQYNLLFDSKNRVNELFGIY